MMKFGFNTTIAQYPVAAECGADYLDILITDLVNASRAELSSFVKAVEKTGVELYSGVCLTPPTLRLTGDIDLAAIRDYSRDAFSRMAEVGLRIPVFGSAGSKSVPDGFPRAKAWEQLYAVASIFADEAERYGMTVVIEGLRRAVVNIVNTVDEAAEYARHVGRSGIQLLADFYHVNENGEPLSSIEAHRDILRHVHMCSPARGMTDAEDTDFLRERFALLKRMGYEGRISFEGNKPEDCAGMREMLDTWRAIYAEA